MAPRVLKRKSEVLDDEPGPTTPTSSPARKKLKVTETQKQAIIDNLQLEITERARKLRAGYALQCEDLRARVERRVNRIPLAMRKMTMGELMARHTQAEKPKSATPAKSHSSNANARERPLPPLPQEQFKAASPVRHLSPPKSKKRKSSHIQIAADQDNDVFAQDTLPIAKKTRGKAAAPPRAASRAGKPVNVLSPRSHNSRTLPQSPIKQMSPLKSAFTRPISPLKPASPFKTAASAATSAISASMHGMIESTKRGTAAAAGKLSRTASREKTSPAKPAISSPGKMLPPARPILMGSPQRTASQTSSHTNTSEASAMSSGTTIIKTKRGTRATATAIKAATTAAANTRTKRAAAAPAATKSTAASAAKEKAAGAALRGKNANKKVVVAEPAVGRRVLRKRE